MGDTPNFTLRAPNRDSRTEAIIQATTAAIQGQGVPLNATSCVGAMMTMLESGPDASTVDILLSILEPLMESKIIKSRFQWMASILGKTMASAASSKQRDATCVSITKTCYQLLATLLVHVDLTTLHKPLALGMFQNMVLESIKPVDEPAHPLLEPIRAIMQRPPAPSKHLSKLVTDITSRAICQALTTSQNSSTAPLLVPHIRLLACVAAELTASSLSRSVDVVVKLPALGSAAVTAAVFTFLAAVLKRADPLPVAQVETAVQKLVGLQPDFSNTPIGCSYVAALVCSPAALVKAGAAAQSVSQFMMTAASLLVARLVEGGEGQLMKASGKALVTLMHASVGPAEDGLVADGASIRALTDIVLPTLGLPAQDNWLQGLRAVTALVNRSRVAGGEALEALLPVADVMGSMWKLVVDDSYVSPALKSAMKDLAGALVRCMGPGALIDRLPLELSQKDGGRAWLLTVIRQHTCRARLAEFGERFVPITNALKEHSLECINEGGRAVEAKHAEWRYTQVWGVLVGYCNRPLDLPTAFPSVARPLAERMKAEPVLVTTVASALCALIRNAQDDVAAAGGPVAPGMTMAMPNVAAADRYTLEEAEAALKVLAQFARNFLPLFFTLYMTTAAAGAAEGVSADEDEKQREILLAIAAFATLATTDLIDGMLKQSVTKVLQATQQMAAATDLAVFDRLAREKRHLLDLSAALAPVAPAACRALVVRMALPQLTDTDPTVQKKSYRLLALVCGDNTEGQIPEAKAIAEGMAAAAATTAPAARTTRLEAIGKVAAWLDPDVAAEFARAVIVEVVMGTKEAGADARAAADVGLSAIAERMSLRTGEGQGAIELYTMLLAGFASTDPHMLSASVLAMSRFVFEYFESNCGAKMLNDMLHTSVVLVGHQNKEVCKATLEMIKVCMKLIRRGDEADNVLMPVLGALVRGVCSAPANARGRFNQQVRVLLERMARKTSFEAVSAVMPEEHAKLLVHIRKEYDKSKRPKQDRDKANAGDARKKYKLKRGKGLMISEGGVEGVNEPVDLMDESSLARSLGGSGGAKKKRGRDDAGDEAGEADWDDEGMLVVGDDDPCKEEDNDVYDDDERVGKDDMTPAGKKRRIGTNGEKTVGHSYNRPNLSSLKNRMSRNSAKSNNYKVQHTGTEFSGKRSKGDLKKDGKMEPFAYVPMSHMQLNRRTKHQVSKKMRSIVKIKGKRAKK